MSERPSVDPRPDPQDLASIQRTVRYATNVDPPMFQLTAVLADSPSAEAATREEVRTTAASMGKQVREIRMADLHDSPLRTLRENPPKPEESVLLLSGLEEASDSLYYAFNLQRDLLAQEFPRLWIILGRAADLARMYDTAPDWSDFAVRLEVDVALPVHENPAWERYWDKIFVLSQRSRDMIAQQGLDATAALLEEEASASDSIDEQLAHRRDRAFALHMQGHFAEALTAARQVRAAALREGRFELAAAAALPEALALADLGETEAAIAAIDSALGHLHGTGTTPAHLALLRQKAMLLENVGTPDQAQEAWEEMERALSPSEHAHKIEALLGLATAAAQRGATRRAASCLNRAIGLMPKVPQSQQRGYHFRAQACLARIAIAQGRNNRAQHEIDDAWNDLRQLHPANRMGHGLVLFRLSRELEDWPGCERAVETLLHWSQEMGAPAWAGVVHWLHAGVLHQQDRAREETAALTRAREQFHTARLHNRELSCLERLADARGPASTRLRRSLPHPGPGPSAGAGRGQERIT